ncbi:spore coat protein [Alkalicoccobacillus porphyridii]|uniref:Spore coat protein n=1 Tax=Alkalicoccobacillus porphyridii TaxID=2597270 RepID=A0A554A3I6_9BACI|nr:spore coat protein [Alkalicoccobacillus porphyridii]TSB48250.1 spore coat protein [Alkalicoccobacillus porphyridii]
MKIQNQEVQYPKNTHMTDREFITDMLTTEKYITSAYDIAENEASHSQLYQDINMIYQESQDCQRHLYTLMFQKGLYAIESESPQKLQQSYQQFSGYSNQLPYTNTH